MNDSGNPPSLRDVTLDDKYELDSGRVFLTGIQALVRLPLMQRRRDLAAGHDTAGYISGYRGSPLGGFDQQLTRARSYLDAHHVVFQPGVNEDLAATAVWGTQQAGLEGEGAYDGVFAMWYGKGPGVDRSGDAFRHGNLAGSAPLGGVLALLGDDHTCESSTTAHQSEFAMVDAMMPILNPAGVQEILDYGLFGWALSRYSGCWVALKCVHDTVEATASVAVDPDRVQIAIPDDHPLPEDGLNIRWPDTSLGQEARLHGPKLDAVRAFCRVNALDRLVMDSAAPRVGVITVGKSYLDVRQALDDLGIDTPRASELGLRLYKVAMPWPLEPEGARRFCRGLDLVIVVEEKRSLIEYQLKDYLYGSDGAPRIIGKHDETGRSLFASAGRLDSNQIASVIGHRLMERGGEALLAARVDHVDALLREPETVVNQLERRPYFCAGCPHNTSTRVPQGSRALAGIGCHYMAQWMDRNTARFTQMGAEGASWIGEAPFSKRGHMFQNIGDGTYYHSGLLAIRAAVASGVNITFKILYNDAVAMTGGQGMDGPLTVPMISQQVLSEGAARVVVVTDDPDRYPSQAGFAPGVTVHHRDELDAVQRKLRDVPGTTALIYDQTCAAEKRRRRKRGRYPDPPKRVFINEAVCEGCGDCGLKSNCVAILPVETELGRKRAIDQSACNKDYSCLAGFCPSFVTVHGGHLRKRSGERQSAGPEAVAQTLPEPVLPGLDQPYGVVVTGIGGTGVVTIGALLGMAAHLEGKGCSVLDMIGLAQKGGAVVSHLRIAEHPDDIAATRIAAGGARLLLGCDMLVTASADALRTVHGATTGVVVNTFEAMTGDFTREADLAFPSASSRRRIESAAGAGVHWVEATRLATALLGDSIATNLFMLGFAYQLGLVPVSAAAILRAIELNGVAVEMNARAFEWGRRAALDVDAVERQIGVSDGRARSWEPRDLDERIEHRAAYLTEYQDAAYAQRYRALVAKVRAAESERAKGLAGLGDAAARYYFKLLAYKDEYEVARLYTQPEFLDAIRARFDGDYSLEFHLAPPLLPGRDAHTGEPKKRSFGPWMMTVFGWLAKLKRLRGSPFDPFGYASERRRERQLIREYETIVAELADNLDADNHALAVEIASLPEYIRGFGPVKERHIERTKRRERELLDAFRSDAGAPRAA